MSDIDTRAEAVERKAAWLVAASRDFDLPRAARDVLENSAAALRALAAERDALRALLVKVQVGAVDVGDGDWLLEWDPGFDPTALMEAINAALAQKEPGA